jgi:SAM-dependent methyltransferase
MVCFTPNRDPGDAERTLATLVRSHLDPLPFSNRIRHLQRTFSAYQAFCPPPWAGPDLQITPEITYQSELWLPLDQLLPHFLCLYRNALTYPPILSSTSFAQDTSWAAIVAGFPPFLKQHDNPATLLEQLIGDDWLRMRFLFWSFMPGRFYGGGSDRYPAQSVAITEWLRQRGRHGKQLLCLDAACGDGAASYGLARLCAKDGWPPDMFKVEGWTLEPLEAWAAAQGCFPHDPVREGIFRDETSDCFKKGFDTAIRFCCADILDAPRAGPFDLILCNGLLGGPIIHGREDMEIAVRNLADLLAPGGMLLAADHFHGGWKQQCPQQELRALFEKHGMKSVEIGGGIGGITLKEG